MKKLLIIFIFMFLFCISSFAQTYTFYSNKVTAVKVNTEETVTNYNNITFTLNLYVDDGYATMYLSSGAIYNLTVKSVTSSEIVFNGQLAGSSAGNAYVHFYFSGKTCYKIIIQYTDYIFIYTRE